MFSMSASASSTGAQQCRLFVGPGVEIPVVETVLHRHSPRRAAAGGVQRMAIHDKYGPASLRPKGLPMDFALTDRTAADPRRGAEALRPVRRRVLAGTRPDRDLPGCLLRRHGRGQLARHRDARGVWRRRPRHHRGGDPDAGGRRVRRLHVGCIGDSPEHLRPQPGGGVRHRGAEAAHAAADRRGPGKGLLRGYGSRMPASTPRRSPRAPIAAAIAT